MESIEIWEHIIGYEGLYQISNLGRVKRLVSFKCKKERILRQSLTTTGYFKVGLYKNAFGENRKIHRLIAIHFMPNPNNLPYINHKDGNKLNNSIDNLEWCTAKENSAHAKVNNLCNISGSRHHNAKLTEEIVIEMRAKYKSRKTNVIIFASQYRITKGALLNIIARRAWSHI